MICYAETTNQIRPAEGISGQQPFCVTTSVGFSCWGSIMEDVKKCGKCKQIKPISGFCKNKTTLDGLGRECKTCANARFKKYFQTERGKELHRFSAKRHRQTNKCKETRKKYRQTEKSKNAIRLYESKNKIKSQAQHAINHAIEYGKKKRAKSLNCSCGENARYYHHYLGYEKVNWFDVIPVCADCHWNLHNLENK